MNQNNITDNVKRAMVKALYAEIMQKLDSGKISTITSEELVAHLEQFAAAPPAETCKKILADDVAGKDIKERFWKFGSISCGNGTLLLRVPTDSDRNGFLRLQQEYSSLRSLLGDEKYCANIWKEHNNNTALMISITQDGTYIGYCGINDLSKSPWEIAIELLPEWTHLGIGTAAITATLDALAMRLDVADFKIRIDPNNIASQRLFEKLGAAPNGISKFVLYDEDEIIQCEEANLHLINDSLIAVAQKFGVAPRKLLSHVLEYRLCWSLHSRNVKTGEMI